MSHRSHLILTDNLVYSPHHWAQAASFGIGMAAGVGTAAVTRIRTQRFLEAVNRDFFGPRGLKVSICKGHDLAPRIGVGQLLPEIPLVVSFRSNRLIILTYTDQWISDHSALASETDKCNPSLQT